MILIFGVLALVLYLCAPNEYNQQYCILLAILYAGESIYILKQEVKKKNYITFNSIFLLSFFFVSYAFAAFIAGTAGEEILAYLIKRVDLRYLTKAVALSHLAINCYFLGFTYSRRVEQIETLEPGRFQIRVKTNSIFIKEHLAKTIYILIYVATFFNYLSHLRINNSVAVTENAFFYDLYRCILIVTLTSSTLKNVKVRASFIEYCRKNILYISTSFIYILLCLVIGDRGPAIFCVLIITVTYLVAVKRINGSIILLSGAAAAMLMFTIRITRGSSGSIQSGLETFTQSASTAIAERSSAWDTMADLTGIFAEMTVGYESVQAKGTVYPLKIIIVPFYPFPLIPSFFSNLIYNKSPTEISSASIISEYAAIPWANGTQCVVDIYISWGLFGVIILFFLFGRFIKWIYNKSNKNIYCLLVYIMLTSMSLYMPRDSMLAFIRPMAYIIFFAALIIKPVQQRHLTEFTIINHKNRIPR